MPDEFFLKPDSPHGLAKKVILYRYLQCRFSGLLNHRKTETKYQFVYFDAFAGTGKYSGESQETEIDVPFTDPSYGSPVVALHALLSAMERTNTSCSVLMIFEEAHGKHIKQLKENVDAYLNGRKSNKNEFICFIEKISTNDCFVNYSVRNTNETEFQIDINFVHSKFTNFNIRENMPDDFNSTRVFSFIDPFGYKDIPMMKIREFIGYRKDVLITFMTSFVKRFKNEFPQLINKLFGTETSNEWKEYIGSFPEFYQQEVARRFDENVEDDRRSLKTLRFSMKKTQNQVIYHMIFFTDELRGLYDMKYGMCSAKESVELCFTDAFFNSDEPTFHVVTDFGYEADYIYECLKGQTWTFGKLKEWILTESPFQIHSKALRKLERERKLTVETYGENRINKALPAHVGVNSFDPDYDEPCSNQWTINFL